MDENEIIEAQDAPVEEQPVETPEVKTEQKRTVPLEKFLAEKEKRKALERHAAELERKVSETPAKNFFEKYKALGMDDELARAMADDFAAMTTANRKPERDIIGEELEDLTLEEFFDDAKSFEKEIRKAIEDSRGTLDVRSAYIHVRNPSDRAREIANRGKASPALKAQPTSKPTASERSDALTPTEREDLEHLKELQPSMNWDAESYKKYVRNK